MSLLGLIVAVILFVLLYILSGKLPAPYGYWARIVIVVVGIIILVWLLLGMLPLGAHIG